MASKKRKVAAECRSLALCGSERQVRVPRLLGRSGSNKNSNLEGHYSAKHEKLDALKGQVCVDKVAALRRSFIGQQEVLSNPFVECLIAAVELLAPEKLKLFQSVSLSSRTEPNLDNQLRLASSSLPPDIRRLTKEKQFQPLH